MANEIKLTKEEASEVYALETLIADLESHLARGNEREAYGLQLAKALAAGHVSGIKRAARSRAEN